METMRTLKARVEKGRLVMNEPTDLPEGAEFTSRSRTKARLDPEERAKLDAAIDESWEAAERGETRPASELLEKLKKI